MSLTRKVGLFEGLSYRGGGPMWAWILHRVSGIGIILFVGLHIISSFFMQQLASDLATTINTIYESWMFQIVVVFLVIFHFTNGLRIIILDFLPHYQTYQREALWLQLLVILPVYGLTVFILIRNGITGG